LAAPAEPSAGAGAAVSAAQVGPLAGPTSAQPTPARPCEARPEPPSPGVPVDLRSGAPPAAGSRGESAADETAEARGLQHGWSGEQLPGGSAGDSPQAARGRDAEPPPQDPVAPVGTACSSPAGRAPSQPPISSLDEVVRQILQGLQEHQSVLLQAAELDPSIQALLEMLRSSRREGQPQGVPSA